MRILDVAPRVTSLVVGGSQRRMGAILDRLAVRHEVVRFAQPRLAQVGVPAGPGEVVHRSRPAAALTELGERTWPTAPILCGPALRLARRSRLRSMIEAADVTVVEFPWQFAHCKRLAPDARLVLSAHNVEADRFGALADAAGARLTRRPWLAWVERAEREAVERAELVVAVSQRDRDRLSERYGLDPDRVIVAPNGADLDALRPAGRERRAAARAALGLDERPVVLFAGADVTPNRAGLEWVRAVAALSDRFTFLVVGMVGGRPRREGHLVVTGHVDDFEAHVAAADLAICPIEFGGGTKVKLVESLAAGLPTVAFAESLQGLEALPGRDLLVAGTSARALLDALDRLADDRGLASEIGASARRYASEHHDWNASALAVERALEALVAPPIPAPPRRRATAAAA
jgi:glycosyltransferase involved in cell wall biosynthesis